VPPTRNDVPIGVTATDEGIVEIAGRSRGTPRVANRLLRRVRDYAELRGDGVVTIEAAFAALKVYDVDDIGLDRLDKAVLVALVAFSAATARAQVLDLAPVRP